jgi:hypothetical protein
MPCRLQPHIWISDDTLAAAYRRFANTCLVNHTHTNTRRHGSNVPGPLEARRRLARRRMAGLSMPNPSLGLIPDFGALFGSGGVDMTSLWAPPSTTQSRAPSPPHHTPPAATTPRSLPTLIDSYNSRTAPPPPEPLHDQKPSLDEYTISLASCRTLDSLARAHAAMHSDSSVSLNFSKAALRTLLKQSTPDQILAFLQSDLNHELAHNSRAYLNHLFATDVRSQLLRDLFCLVCDKIALSTMLDEELSHILTDMAKEAAGIDQRLLLELNTMLHQSLVQAYAPSPPPMRLRTQLLKNMLFLPPSPDVLELMAALVSFSSRSGSQVMIKYLKQAILSRTERLGPSDQLMPILSVIPDEHFDFMVFSATEKFVKSLCDLQITHVDRAERLVCWLDDLCLFRPSILDPDSSWASLLYPFLASKFTIAELGAHLRALHPADAAIIVLHNWIKPTILEVPEIPDSDTLDITSGTTPATVHHLPLQHSPTVHSRHGSKVKDPLQTYGVGYTMSRSTAQSSTPRANFPTRQDVFDRIASTLRESCKPDQKGVYPSRGGAWVQLFRLLSENGIDYTGWLSDLFQVLKHHKSPVWTYHFFAQLTKNNVHIPYAVAVDIMRHFIDMKKTQWALDVFNRSQSTQWLSNIPELLFALIDSRAVKSTEAIFDLLNRPDYANSLPVNLRLTAQNSLSKERIQLVHHAAYAIAKSPLLSSRMAFRQVCDCLNYLRDRDAPLSSLMSRALVHAGVTRPLRDGSWLSTEKFQWILSFVRRLEGDEVADSLDEAAFTLRSENFELSRAQMEPLDDMEREADQIAWEYRKQFLRAPRRPRWVASPYNRAGPKKTRGQKKLEFAKGSLRRI